MNQETLIEYGMIILGITWEYILPTIGNLIVLAFIIWSIQSFYQDTNKDTQITTLTCIIIALVIYIIWSR